MLLLGSYCTALHHIYMGARIGTETLPIKRVVFLSDMQVVLHLAVLLTRHTGRYVAAAILVICQGGSMRVMRGVMEVCWDVERCEQCWLARWELQSKVLVCAQVVASVWTVDHGSCCCVTWAPSVWPGRATLRSCHLPRCTGLLKGHMA